MGKKREEGRGRSSQMSKITLLIEEEEFERIHINKTAWYWEDDWY